MCYLRFNGCRGRKRPNKTETDDSPLFNEWLSSEIKKNSMKIDLTKAKIGKISAEKELIDVKRAKITFKIENMQNTTQLLS